MEMEFGGRLTVCAIAPITDKESTERKTEKRGAMEIAFADDWLVLGRAVKPRDIRAGRMEGKPAL